MRIYRYNNRYLQKLLILSIAVVSWMCNGNNGRSFDEKGRKELADAIEKSMITEVLDVWYPQAIDHDYGGFVTGFTYDWQRAPDQRKMIVSQARHVWVNSKAALLYPERKHFIEGAAHGFQFLKDVMWDHKHGGFHTLVTYNGEVIDSAKNAYGNAFGLFALAAYYKASQDTAALDLAKKVFHWLEVHSHDDRSKGYFQHMTYDGKPVVRDATTSSTAERGYKDHNSSIHLLEAFTELYQVWPDGLVKKRLTEMLYLIRDTITTKQGYMKLFFTPDWKHITFRDSTREVIEVHHYLDHVSFGHDVETAYLMLEASHVLGIENDTTTLRMAKLMVDHSIENGWDKTLGGFYDAGYYFKGDDKITIVRDNKNWWAQAEGLNSLLIMADKFPLDKMKYFEKFEKLWKYIDSNLIDHTHGDWYAGGLDKQPFQKTALKGHVWKATYHHFRSMSLCVDQLRGHSTLPGHEQ